MFLLTLVLDSARVLLVLLWWTDRGVSRWRCWGEGPRASLNPVGGARGGRRGWRHSLTLREKSHPVTYRVNVCMMPSLSVSTSQQSVDHHRPVPCRTFTVCQTRLTVGPHWFIQVNFNPDITSSRPKVIVRDTTSSFPTVKSNSVQGLLWFFQTTWFSCQHRVWVAKAFTIHVQI